MAEYIRYTVDDAEGVDSGNVWEQSEIAGAEQYAQRVRGQVIAQEYEWTDSYLVSDYTVPDEPEGED